MSSLKTATAIAQVTVCRLWCSDATELHQARSKVNSDLTQTTMGATKYVKFYIQTDL